MTAPRQIAVEDFPHEFSEPFHAELAWEWDDMHMPFAVTPLAGDYATRLIGAGLNYQYIPFGLPDRIHSAVFNGWVYYAYAPGVPEAERKANDDRMRIASRERGEVTLAYWHEEALPELAALYGQVDGVDVEGLSGPEAAEAWLGAWVAMERAWQIHFILIVGPYQIAGDLADLYERHTPGAPAGEALRLIQGRSPDLFAVAAALDQVVDAAAAAPAVAERLGAGPAARVDLEALPGGPAFLAEMDAFLGQHGHLGQAYDDLAQPSYAEDPALLLAEVAHRLERPAESATDRRARLHAEADALADGLRSRLAEQPDELDEFERVLALARSIGHLTEGHNYWIDRKAQATLRRFVVRVGGRLAREGALAEPDDILFLEREEVAETLRKPQDRRALVDARRAAYERWRSIKPPAKLGKLDAPEENDGRFSAKKVDSTEANVLRGSGASPGVIRGPARVALSNADFPRIRPGDIIVCPSSNPSWVPVFTIAGGLVTNTGGVLSHAAVVAREFALPAVVGVANATHTIRDGQAIEIDGTEGTVRLL